MREHPDPQRGPKTAHGEGCASTSADRKLLKSATVPPRAKPPPSTVACSCVRKARNECDAGACAGGLKAEDRVIACPKGPAVGHAHRHHRTAVTLAARPLRRSGRAGQVRCGDHARDRVRTRQPGAGVHRRQRRQGFTGAGLPAGRPPRQPRSCRSPPADPQRPGPGRVASVADGVRKTGGAARCRTRRRAQAGRRHDGPLAVAMGSQRGAVREPGVREADTALEYTLDAVLHGRAQERGDRQRDAQSRSIGR